MNVEIEILTRCKMNTVEEAKESWKAKLVKIPNLPYYIASNGNIYCSHSIFIHSGPLHAVQIQKCFQKLLGHNRFVLNTVRMGNQYICQTYAWFDDERDFERIISGELQIPPFELEKDQIDASYDSDSEDRNYFCVTISPTFISPSVGPDVNDLQLFINKVSKNSHTLLRRVFDRFAISNPERKVSVIVSQTKRSQGEEYWALINFTNRYDCAFAYLLTHTLTCLDENREEVHLRVRYGKETTGRNNYNFHKRNERW